ncbi:autotransporter outer membrane beta-barrel domain-containing protein [Azorhizobium doebereinerae]|uniref:autotransporter outer membrane beta-barrel domain-containing protein n=1 Tax=Azorhizobium doebereinerae TaxID=281091 RepID=UPI0003F57283|nr:autotransporter domain-containing protein [Azorhizobium doebereinerae]
MFDIMGRGRNWRAVLLRRAAGMVLAGVTLAGWGFFPAGAASAAGWTMYDSYSQSYFISYQRGLDAVVQHGGSLTFDVTVNGHVLNPTMDTGSTGFVVSANQLGLNAATLTGTPGWVFYNSTGLLVTGYFRTETLTFQNGVDAHGVATTVTATLPILVVTEAQCLGGGGNSANCDAAGAKFNTLMMGVGFDRNTMGTGTVDTSNAATAVALLNSAAATPQAYNPFLNIDGTSASTYRNGYIVTPTGVVLGLTGANTAAGYSYAQLTLGPAQTGTTWQAVQATVTVDKASGTGTLLMDTGVTDAFIGLPKGSTVVSSNGTLVTLVIEGGIATYSFRIGDMSNPQTPDGVNVYTQNGTFVNSSVHTYAGYNVLYDADGGFIGLALNYYPGSTAQVTQMIAAQGTLSLTADFSTDLPVLLLANSTVLTSSTANFNGDITGIGSLTLKGGVIYLNGHLTQSGGTVAAQGVTVLNGTLIGSLSVLQGATFIDANGGYNVAAGQTLINQGTFAAPAGVGVTNAGTTINSGTVAASFTNTGTTINTGVFSGNVANSGLFTNNGAVTGAVDNSGILGGNGAMGSLVVRPGGTVSPGNSIGVQTVAGNATFQPGSTLLVELGAPGTSDQLVVGGTLTAGGATLVPVLGAGFTARLGASYQVITAGNIASDFTVASPFFGTAGATYPFLAGTMGGTGTLTLTRSAVSYAAFAPTANAAAAGRAADTLPTASPLMQSLALMGGAAAPAALSSLTGEIYASAQSVLQVQSAYVRGAVLGRLEQAATGTPGTAQTVALDRAGTTLWAQAYGGWGSTGSDGNASAVTRSIGGFLIGLDGSVSDWRLGFAGGFSQSDFSTDSLPGSGSSDNYDVALYAGRSFGADASGAFNLRAGAAYGWHDLSVSRTVMVPGQVAGYGAGYSAGTAQLFGEIGYGWNVKGAGVPLTLEPFAGLAYTALATNGFTETGAAALTAQDAHFDTLSSTLGLKARAVIAAGSALPLTLSGTIGWQHAFGDVTPTTTLAFTAGSAPFTVAGAPLAQDALVLGAGLGARLSDTVEVSLAYNGQLASGFTETAVKGAFSWRF